MIDIHSHILPGLDDGAKSIEETLGIVRQLNEAGFSSILATPHVLEGSNYLSPEEILSATDKVRKFVAKEGIPVEILPGAENYIFPDMAKWAREGKLLTLGNTGKYLLLELPMLELPHYTEQVLFELQVNGLIPIIAHPERYRYLYDEPEQLLRWANKGIFFQLDIRSLSGRYGPQAKWLGELMLMNELLHFVGSDAHRVSRSELSYVEELQKVKNTVGDSRFLEVTRVNPQSILDGVVLRYDREYILRMPAYKKRRRFWSLFSR